MVLVHIFYWFTFILIGLHLFLLVHILLLVHIFYWFTFISIGSHLTTVGNYRT